MRTPRRIAAATPLLVACFASAAAIAQPRDVERQTPVQEQQRPAQGLREAERAARAQEAAEALKPLESGRTVTYDDVLKSPDDIELNYLYAQSQVARGDLRGAASTLERILLLAPDLARVRLLYGVVLYRLDNLPEAERELRAVSKLPMDARLREEVDFYLEQIALRSKPTRFAATLGGGMQWDSNRNAGPDGDRVLFLDRPFELVTGRKESDWAGVMLAGIRATHDLGYDAGHALLGGVQVYGQKQVDVDELDLMSISGETGALYRAPGVDLQPSLFGSYLNLSGESYVSSVGAGLRANHRFSQSLDVFARFRFDYEIFNQLDDDPTSNERSGARLSGGVGATWSPWPRLRLDGGIGLLHKHGLQDWYTYTGPVAGVAATYLLGRGQFLLSTFSFELDLYEGPEKILTDQTRRDRIWIAGLGYGAPLGTLLPFTASTKWLRDTLLTWNATYLNEQSTIENYQYDDWRFTLLWTKSFEF